MNNRISAVIVTAILVTLTSGCRSTLGSLCFGRGARCGLCNKLSAPQFGNTMQAPCASPSCVSPGRSCLTGPRCRSTPMQTPYQPAPCQAAPYQPAPYQPAPCRPAPYQPAPYQPAPCQAAPYQPAPCQSAPCHSAPTGNCGCNSYADQPCGGTCGNGGYSSAYGDCGCGGVVEGYADGFHDPYLGSEMSMQGGTGSYPSGIYPGQVINGEVVVSPGQVVEGQVMPGNAMPGASSPIPSGDWQPRSYPDAAVPQGSGSPGGMMPPNYQSRKFDTDGNKILWEEPLPASENAALIQSRLD